MMRFCLSLALLLTSTLAAASLCAQTVAAVEWQHYYGGSGAENYRLFMSPRGQMIVSTGDGYAFIAQTESYDGVVTGCHHDSSGFSENDLWLVKTDLQGNIQWQKCFGGSGREVPKCLIRTSDGGFVLGGQTRSHNGDVKDYHFGKKHPLYEYYYYDAWILKTDPVGAMEWAHCIGADTGDDCFNSIIEVKDGFVAAGFCNGLDSDWNTYPSHVGASAGNAMVVKLTPKGELVWHKLIGASPNGGDGDGFMEEANCIIPYPTGGYIFTGTAAANAFAKMWVVRIDTNGDTLWTRRYGGINTLNMMSDVAKGNSIVRTPTGFCVAGFQINHQDVIKGNHGIEDGFIVMIDTNGRQLRYKCLGGSSTDIINSVIPRANGNFLFVGSTSSTDGDVSDVHIGLTNSGGYEDTTDGWVGEFSPDGTLLWQQCLGGYNYDAFFSALETPDHGFLLYGTTQPLFPGEAGDGIRGFADAWAVKVKLVPKGVAYKDRGSIDRNPYPNPSASIVNLELLENVTVDHVQFFNTLGGEVFPEYIVHGGTVVANVRSLPAGVFTIKVRYNDSIEQVRRFLHVR